MAGIMLDRLTFKLSSGPRDLHSHYWDEHTTRLFFSSYLCSLAWILLIIMLLHIMMMMMMMVVVKHFDDDDDDFVVVVVVPHTAV